MTPRQARIALSTFVLLAAGIVYNALYMQSDVASARMAGEATRPAPVSPRTTAQPPARTRTTQGTKRTALLKPDSANANDTPEDLPDEAGADTIRAIQRELNQRGFGPLASDGTMRLVTRAAIMSYEHDNRLPYTAEATEGLLTRLVLGASAVNPPAGAGEVQSPHAEATIKQVQRMLAAGGYRPGPADGRLRVETAAAIRAFEQDQGLAPKGRISADVVSRLQNSATRLKAAEAR
ncbi:MAG TPA: peptidoglycan-binding domain-containing protein [Hyphomicrobiaceae bacterium]|jgi:peptidoglycan hydrolase-like protein with peptidoglycan-binding domain|nr:peptidoglycan-binding domain-containing protein [Hyphomicrobiaceae bacterium]